MHSFEVVLHLSRIIQKLQVSEVHKNFQSTNQRHELLKARLSNKKRFSISRTCRHHNFLHFPIEPVPLANVNTSLPVLNFHGGRRGMMKSDRHRVSVMIDLINEFTVSYVSSGRFGSGIPLAISMTRIHVATFLGTPRIMEDFGWLLSSKL